MTTPDSQPPEWTEMPDLVPALVAALNEAGGLRHEAILPVIRPWLAGHFCNPMNQAWLSLPALRGLAELHGGALPADWEAGALGGALWQRLRRDRDRFLDQGLDGLGEKRRDALASEYAALPGPGAAEAAGWLRGEYVFDPDCLTD